MYVCPECGETTPQPGNCPRDGTPVAAGDDPCLGQSIGSYRIARLLGAGGMGRVYLGVQPTIGSRVAVKVLSRECSQSPELVERFFAEARAVNLIRHEGIVNVLDFTHMPDGRPAIVMEYLDGAPLSAIIEAVGPLPLGGLARIVGEALDALAASHAKAVIHRDLKPDNIFVTQTGHAKVLDFGIAKLTIELARTQAGALLGTPFYMAPEQATASAVDARTDVYSVGVILFEGVTGQKPFAAQTLYSLLRQQVEATPPAPRTLRADLPPAYEAVILKALQKDPAARFGSAKEMALALHTAAESLPPEAWAPVSMPAQAPTVMAGGAKSPLRWTPATPPASLPRPAPTEALSRTLPQKRSGSRTAAILLALVAAAGGGVAITLVATRKAPQTQTQTQTQTRTPTRTETQTPAPTPSLPAPQPVAAPVPAPAPVSHPRQKIAKPIKPEPARTQVAAAPAPGPSPPDAAAAPPSWQDVPITRRIPGFRLPRDFDAKSFEPLGYLPRALKLAQRIVPDVRFIEFDAQGVLPEGRSNLMLSRDFSVNFWFRSPSRSQRAPSMPVGVNDDMFCLVIVELNSSGIEVRNGFSNSQCTDHFRPPPRCSLAAVWERARKHGAPAGNAVAKISYLSLDGKWFFDIDGVLTETIPDDCP